MGKHFKNYVINLLVPAVLFGVVTGAITAVILTLYKWLANKVISFSSVGYYFVSNHLYFIPVVLIGLFLIAYIFSICYKHTPNLRGGGIPTTIGILRDIITLKWLRTLIGMFFMSLVTFLIGVPLGNEGPAVQMGTAIGRGAISPFNEKHKPWVRYSMTGGACAGFAVATGAPVSGIMFAVEEAHQRVSPMIIIVAATAVMFAVGLSEILAPIFNVGTALFPELTAITLSIKDVWLPLVVGLVMGLFAVIFLKYYRVIRALFKSVLGKISPCIKIFIIFVIVFGVGLISGDFISTGHSLIHQIILESPEALMLLIILLVRSTLTLSANTNGITGGMFLPLLAIGAVVSALTGKLLIDVFGLSSEFYSVILTLGITACISGVMKMPITAILFAVEALGGGNNILYVVVVSVVAFIITEIFKEKSITDMVVEHRQESLLKDKTSTIVEEFYIVQPNSFAEGKQLRDILWPAMCYVLSVKKNEYAKEEDANPHGGHALVEGDVLHLRYITYDRNKTEEKIYHIVGKSIEK